MEQLSEIVSPSDQQPKEKHQASHSPTLTSPPSALTRRQVCLQERRGSNVSLVLDVSSLGEVEPLCAISTPRDIILQLLKSSRRPMLAKQLHDASQDTISLSQEYQKIPPNFISSLELNLTGHAVKDRYKTILPNPETRVLLQRESVEEEEGSGYINANYIRGVDGAPCSFIATQGPMTNTVQDFWAMVWQEESHIIVMITQLNEKKEKCVQYWPERTDTYGCVCVSVETVTQYENYTITNLVLQVDSEKRTVRHYWFSTWLDHQIPDSAEPLLQLVQDVQTHKHTVGSPGPVIVHCSAGIGRTGCFIACSIGCRQLQQSGQVDVLQIVCQLRLDRGGMIQTSEQYQFLYAALALFSLQLQDSHKHNKQEESAQNIECEQQQAKA